MMPSDRHRPHEPEEPRGPRRADPGPLASRPGWHLALLVAGLAVTVWAISVPVLGFGWVLFDDDINILLNPNLGRSAAKTVGWAVTNLDYIRRYVPLGWVEFDAVLAVDGYRAAVFHLASLVVHTVNALLAFFVLRALLRPMFRPRDGATGESAHGWRIAAGAVVGALVWSVHPLRAENVGWISGLFYLGSSTFALLATGQWLRESAAGVRVSVASAVLFASSLLIYPVYSPLPLLLLVYVGLVEGCSRRVLGKSIQRLSLWWLIVVTVAAVDERAALTAKGAFALGNTHLDAMVWWTDLIRCYAHYAAYTIWPQSPGVYYGKLASLLAPAGVAAGAAVALVASVGLCAWRATRRGAIALLASFVVAFAPFLLQIDPSFTPSDRYAVPWLAVVAVGVAAIVARPKARAAQVTTVAILAVVLTASTVAFRSALASWRDTFALQAQIDRNASEAPNPKLNFGRPALELWMLGRRDEARQLLGAGIRRFPYDPSLRETQATLAQLTQRFEARLGDRTDVPPLAVLQVDVGNGCLVQGDVGAAQAHYRAALDLAPDYSEALHRYAQSMRTKAP